MKLSPAINLGLGCIISLALKKYDPSCQIIKITLSEKNGAMVYFTSEKTISFDNFSEINLLIQELIKATLPIKNLSDCTLDELKNNPQWKKITNISKLFSSSQTWQKIQIQDQTLIVLKDDISLNKLGVKYFSLEAIGGANLDGEELANLKVISGVGFASLNEKKAYDQYCEELKQRDHRRLGQQLEIFTFNDLVGKGLPLWLPNGGIIKNLISDCINHLWKKYGFSFVSTPVIGTLDLYKKSGHWAHYRDYMFPLIETDNERFVLRPMTCPHHCLIYQTFQHLEKDLPLRLSEHSLLARYETSGGLVGLERVRMMTLPDVHIFCRADQVMDEITNCYHMIEEAIKLFGFSFSRVDLSLHDPDDKEKYVDNPSLWKICEEQLRTALKKLEINFVEKIGEAAFYGPKIDFQVNNYSSKVITVSTIQFDFNLPTFFNLKYKKKNGEEGVPVIIHFGILGTFERFIAILLEQTKGVFPFWLAIKQVRLLPVDSKKHWETCEKIAQILRAKKIRVDIDGSEERLAKKIRTAQMAKIPFQVVVGDTEASNNFAKISYRKYGEKQLTTIKFEEFVSMLVKENDVF